MVITWLGYTIIPISVVLFFFKPNWLYYIFIFFVPFSSSVIVNFTTLNTGLSVSHFLGILCLLRWIIEIFFRGKIIVYPQLKLLTILITFLGIIVILSLSVPYLINGRISIIHPETYVVTPLKLSFFHITQTSFFLYGLLILCFIIYKVRDEETFKKSIKAYLYSGVFISLWGYFQLFCFYFNIPYPYYIFNNNINVNASGYYQYFADINVKRISSVTLEPSIFAQVLITMLSILIVNLILKRYIFSFKKDLILVVLFLTSLMLSTSSTAYLGLVFLSLVILFFMLIYNRIRLAYIGFIVLFFLFACFIILFIPTTRELFNSIIINKINSQSGYSRLQGIKTAFEYFKLHPILGLGFGSVKSHDLVAFILSNCGVLGFISLFSLFTYIISNLFKSIRENFQNVFSYSLLISFSVLLFISMISGFIFYLGHFWFVMALASVAPTIRFERFKLERR
jgi:O-Antigen ligase